MPIAWRASASVVRAFRAMVCIVKVYVVRMKLGKITTVSRLPMRSQRLSPDAIFWESVPVKRAMNFWTTAKCVALLDNTIDLMIWVRVAN